VADHSKWGVIGISSIARLDQADVLITDSGISPEARIILADAVRELVVVEPAGSALVSLDMAHAH
jgi:DeoR/GlpR family transcriptional regulator of sugar metabolism